MTRRRLRKPLEWLNNNSKALLQKYEYPAPNQFVTGNKFQPFPLNPTFVVQPVLRDRTKDRIYQLHKQQPEVNTPRKLAQDFHISLARTKAIIKLKSLQSVQEEEGKGELQHDFSRKMDDLLSASDRTTLNAEALSLRDQANKKGSTGGAIWMALDEGEEPPTLLFNKSTTGAGGGNPKTLALTQDGQVIEKNPQVKSKRFSYVITELNKEVPMNERRIMVREKDGLLRFANLTEKIIRRRGIIKSAKFSL